MASQLTVAQIRFVLDMTSETSPCPSPKSAFLSQSSGKSLRGVALCEAQDTLREDNSDSTFPEWYPGACGGK